MNFQDDTKKKKKIHTRIFRTQGIKKNLEVGMQGHVMFMIHENESH